MLLIAWCHGPKSFALADRIEAYFKKRGFGLWALEIVGIDSFAGFVGLSTPRFEAPFTPCVAERRRDVTGRTADTLSCRRPTRASSRGCWLR